MSKTSYFFLNLFYRLRKNTLKIWRLTFSLQNDVNLHHQIFLNLLLRLRKTILQNLETKG